MAVVFDDINKIIEVEAPATEITIQDLLNEIREYEDDLANMDLPNIARASGKQFLGGTTYVGITIELLDGWRVKFEDRPGTDYVQCSVTGGNIVAYDSEGSQQFPLAPSTYVFATITASASATLQEQDSLQYSSFSGGVWINGDSPYTGTSFPVGTPQQPVNNLADAMLIAGARGFTTLYVIGSLTIDEGGNYTGMAFVGESVTKTIFTITSDANVTNCEFYEATIQGTLDGNCKLENCKIYDLEYIYGIIESCLLSGTITLGGENPAHFLDCWSGVTGDSNPIIDCGGSGQDLALRNYNGGIKIINKTGTDDVTIDLNSGRIVLDTTVTNGSIIVRGVGYLVDNSTGTAIIDSEALINNMMTAHAVWDESLADHLEDGSAGKSLSTASTGGVDLDELADAVWEKPATTDFPDESMGDKLKTKPQIVTDGGVVIDG